MPPRERRWALVKLGLGLPQMMSATGAATLLMTGMNVWSLAMVVATCVLTTLSVLLFGSRRSGPNTKEV